MITNEVFKLDANAIKPLCEMVVIGLLLTAIKVLNSATFATCTLRPLPPPFTCTQRFPIGLKPETPPLDSWCDARMDTCIGSFIGYFEFLVDIMVIKIVMAFVVANIVWIV